MAEFKRVLLYAGAPKTGTTSIQTFLWSNRGALMKQGVYIPRTGRRGAQHMEVPATLHDGKRRSGLDRHADVRADNLQERRSAFVRGLDEELERAPKCHTLLFMSEYLFTSRRKEVRTYRKFFSRYAPRLESLMYLRRQDHWLASLTLQGRKSGTRDDLELTPGPPEDYAGAIRVWDVESYACHIRRFEREFLLDGDLIADFCAAVGAEPPKLATTEVRANPAIMQEQLELMDVLNRKLEKMPFFRRIPYRRTFIAFCADVLGGTQIEFPREAALAAFEAYADINSWLHDTRDPEGPPMFFGSDFSDYPLVAKNGRQYSLKQLTQLKSVVAGQLRDRGLTEPAASNLAPRYSLTDYIASAFISLRRLELREGRRALRESRNAEERALGAELGFTPLENVSEFYDDDDDD